MSFRATLVTLSGTKDLKRKKDEENIDNHSCIHADVWDYECTGHQDHVL